MPWRRHRLRDAEVWAKVDSDGALVTDRDGRVDIVYKPVTGVKVYRASGRNLMSLGEGSVEIEVGERAGERGADKERTSGTVVVPTSAIQVWTDGACTGNPGPAGIGVVVVDGTAVEELTEYLGHGTNNIAELTAIQRGLEVVAGRGRGALERPVVVYSDSQYAIGLLTTYLTESAAPPRASPSVLVKMTASRPRASLNACAERTASCPVIASTTRKV